MSRCYFTFP